MAAADRGPASIMPGTMADPLDAYAMLEVAPDATSDQIRAAYRRLARQYHPDVAADRAAGERMAAINRAYAVLGDPTSRARYDAAQRPPAPAPSPSPRTPAIRVEPPPVWSADVDRHAEDWRQMLAEERRMWEQLLAGNPTPKYRAELERELAQAKQAQLEFENTLRVRAGEAPLTGAEFERRRVTEREQRQRQTHAAGCLLLAVAAPGVTAALFLRTLYVRHQRSWPA